VPSRPNATPGQPPKSPEKRAPGHGTWFDMYQKGSRLPRALAAFRAADVRALMISRSCWAIRHILLPGAGEHMHDAIPYGFAVECLFDWHSLNERSRAAVLRLDRSFQLACLNLNHELTLKIGPYSAYML
jgi:hypothetical protein